MITNMGNVTIHKDVVIRSRFASNVVGGYPCTKIYVDSGAEVIIGEHSGISNTVIYSASKIEIGEYVNIGAGCLITDSDSHSIQFYHRCIEAYDSDVKTAPIKIKKGAFIGANSIILKGVEIGENSVIGAGSVVTQNVPDKEIWAGNPARFISYIKE